jgi:hypothetical protein
VPAGWDVLVVDEGHRLKNAASKLSAALGAVSATMRLLLTGTPLQNNLQELWALLDFVMPGAFGSGDGFRKWFAKPFSKASGAGSLSHDDAHQVIRSLHHVLRPIVLRRTKKQLESELPPITTHSLPVPPSAAQYALAKRIRAGEATVPDPETGAMIRLSMSNQAMLLRRLECHPYLLGMSEHVARQRIAAASSEAQMNSLSASRCSGKAEALCRAVAALQACGHRVLVFSQFTDCLDAIELAMEEHPATAEMQLSRIDGSQSSEERATQMAEFNSPDGPPVMLLSTRAGGVGITLTAADTVVIFDSDWNPQNDLQAMARAHRIGQTRPVMVVRLVAAGVAANQSCEQQLLGEAERKRRMEHAVIRGIDDADQRPLAADADADQRPLAADADADQRLLAAETDAHPRPLAAEALGPRSSITLFNMSTALRLLLSNSQIEAGATVDNGTLAAAFGRSKSDRASMLKALDALPDGGGVLSLAEIPSLLRCAEPSPSSSSSSSSAVAAATAAEAGERSGRATRHSKRAAAGRFLLEQQATDAKQDEGAVAGSGSKRSRRKSTVGSGAVDKQENECWEGSTGAEASSDMVSRTCPLCGAELESAEAMQIHAQFECALLSDTG